MEITSQKIGANDALNRIVLPSITQTTEEKISAKNVIFAIDVSGSMWDQLPLIRTQLKNKIPSLIGPNDTITIIWFSDKNSSGILQEGVKVSNLQDLQKLNDAIDRFLKPIGLTAFLPPLELTERVITNLKPNGHPFSFIFLSDGYNNDSVWSQVVDKVTQLEPEIGSAAFIEYGYYADSAALSEMAELMGGEKIFSKDFDSYDASFEKLLQRQAPAKKVVDISHIKGVKYGFFFAINKEDESILTFSSRKETSILVPENVVELFFITRYKHAEEGEIGVEGKLAATYLLADRLRYNAVEDFLTHIGSVALLEEFTGAFGKDRLNAFKKHIQFLVFHPEELYLSGKQDARKVDPKRFCLIDLIELLQQSDENKFYPFSPDFNYNRIGGKSVTKVELDEETQKQLASSKTLAETQQILKAIETAEFIYPENAADIGIGFDDLVWNADRANLSVRARLNGVVKLPSNEYGLSEVPSFIYRTFTIVKDGVLNISNIPVSLDFKTFHTLFDKGLLVGGNPTLNRHLLDIRSLPVINRSMTTNISGKILAQHEFDLINVQLKLKYLKYLKAKFDPKTNDKSAAQYSPEIANWLKSLGIDDYNGYNPRTELIESGDTYIAPSLLVKIQNTSSLPTVNKVLEKLDILKKGEGSAPKFNLTESIMKSYIDEIENSHGQFFNNWEKGLSLEILNSIFKEEDNRRKKLLSEIARVKFGVILSRSWFKEFDSMDEDTLKGVVFKGIPDKTPLNVKFEFKEVTVKL